VLLAETLHRRHELQPVHSEAELVDLKRRFPEEMQIYETRISGELVAGAITFQLNRATHIQYMCSSEQGFTHQALDNTIEFIASAVSTMDYLSFGISTSRDGIHLNEGLTSFKETFGGTTHCIDHMSWKLAKPNA
jgi:hypothetical protein